jgi:hypothetical protein
MTLWLFSTRLPTSASLELSIAGFCRAPTVRAAWRISLKSGPNYRTRHQRGEGKLKAIIYTLILVASVYVGIKLVPIYVAEYQLKDKMTEQARFAIVNRYSEEQIRDLMYKVVQDLDIPAKREDIKVTNTGKGLNISLSYTVPVDLMVYKTDLTFSPSSDGIDILK